MTKNKPCAAAKENHSVVKTNPLNDARPSSDELPTGTYAPTDTTPQRAHSDDKRLGQDVQNAKAEKPAASDFKGRAGNAGGSKADKDLLSNLHAPKTADLPRGTYAPQDTTPQAARSDRTRLGQDVQNAKAEQPSASDFQGSKASTQGGSAKAVKDPLSNLHAPKPDDLPAGTYAHQTPPHEVDEDIKRLGQDIMQRPTSEQVVDTMSVGTALGMERDANTYKSNALRSVNETEVMHHDASRPSEKTVRDKMANLAAQDNQPGQGQEGARGKAAGGQARPVVSLKPVEGQAHPADVHDAMAQRQEGNMVARGGVTEGQKESAQDFISGGLASREGEGRPTMEDMVAAGQELMQGP